MGRVNDTCPPPGRLVMIDETTAQTCENVDESTYWQNC